MDEDQRASDETDGNISVRSLPERNTDGGNDGLKCPMTLPIISIMNDSRIGLASPPPTLLGTSEGDTTNT